MQDSDEPLRITVIWANGVGSPYANDVPVPSQIGINPGRASFTTGFVPVNFTQVSSGGTPPFGADFNGVIRQITKEIQWEQAGGPHKWNSAFSIAIGGYPKNAIVASATADSLWYLCLAENNTSNPDTGGANWTAFTTIDQVNGQCYLQYTSVTLLTLIPQDGAALVIAGVPRLIPSGGVTLANTGLSATTLYYIYASWTGSAIALEASTTGHVTGSNGVQVKSGDATRTLVGLAVTNGSSQFGLQGAGTLSYYNRRSINLAEIITTDYTTSSSTAVELNAALRVNFCTWANEQLDADILGLGQNGTDGGAFSMSIGVDGIVISAFGVGGYSATAGQGSGCVGNLRSTAITEGGHYATPLGTVGPSAVGTATFNPFYMYVTVKG